MIVDGYFAASNSGRGFANYYPEVFGRAGRIYIIKGGPGTGKSRFMRDVEHCAASHGWECRRYYCSSDPSSLDGIILERAGDSIAVIDGTPPHAWEPARPGVVEQLINLGDFWNADKLRGYNGELAELERLKKLAWKQAYGWLSGCLDMCGIIRTIGRGLVDDTALEQYALSMLAGVEPGDGFCMNTVILNAVGMSGQASSERFISDAATLYTVRDSFMTAHLLLDRFIEQARLRRLDITVSRDPVDPERIDGVMLNRDRIAVVVCDGDAVRSCFPIEMSALNRPAPDDAVNEATHAGRCYNSMLSGAIDALSAVKEYHFRIEEIYSDAMDFGRKEQFTQEFCRQLFG
ncbi:MAG: hypothetical protein PUJ09_00625 [Eubacteriales bacterium]|nr:hypothetical protein [Eubacteriales bacterium]